MHWVNFSKNLKEIPETHRQQLRPKAYIRNGSIYAVKRDLIVKRKRYGTKNSLPYIMDSKNSVNVDNQIDLMVVKQIMNSKKGKI